jgi:hypothetical protein
VSEGQFDSSRARDVFNQMLSAGQTVAQATRALGFEAVDDQAMVQKIERIMKQKLPRQKIAGFDYSEAKPDYPQNNRRPKPQQKRRPGRSKARTSRR